MNDITLASLIDLHLRTLELQARLDPFLSGGDQTMVLSDLMTIRKVLLKQEMALTEKPTCEPT